MYFFFLFYLHYHKGGSPSTDIQKENMLNEAVTLLLYLCDSNPIILLANLTPAIKYKQTNKQATGQYTFLFMF